MAYAIEMGSTIFEKEIQEDMIPLADLTDLTMD